MNTDSHNQERGTSQTARHLYIIGNGFDRHHGAESTYFHFREYLARCDSSIVADFELFFGDGGLFRERRHSELWADFEQNLSELDREKVFDYVDLFLPEVDDDHEDFSRGEYFEAIEKVEDIVTRCTTSMQHHFHKWINTLHYEKGFKCKMVELDRDALFLNFNYTPHLENEYHIPREQILYIHGDRRDKEDEIVLGHNVEDSEKALDKWIHKHKNRRRYRHNLKDKKGRYFANDKLVYLAYFHEGRNDYNDKGNYRKAIRYYAIDHIQQYLAEYYDHNVKHCEERIAKNADFFASLASIEEITVLGHSLAEVDKAYFEKIAQVVGRRAKWNFSYYNDKDIARINKFCRNLKIPKPTGSQLFRMERIIPS